MTDFTPTSASWLNLVERYSHGHVFDFYQRLRANPNELRVLVNGRLI